MAPTPFDWSRLIAEMTDESFGIAPDVTFQIVDNGLLHEVKENGHLHEVKENGLLHEVKENGLLHEVKENGQLHEVKAHKMILGMVSHTFKTMFYATNVGDKTAEVIKIEKITAPAFRIIMDAVYNVKSIEDSLTGKSVHQVFDVVILVERYQIVELMEAAKELLASYPIADDTVMEVAEDAMEYSNMFEAEAQELLLTCAKFLRSKLKRVKSVARCAKKNEDKKDAFATVMAKIDDITASDCPNCNKEICQNGFTVKDDEFRVGLKVTNNRAVVTGYDHGTGQVTKVETASVNVKSIKPGVNQFRGWDYPKTLRNVPRFLFACK